MTRPIRPALALIALPLVGAIAGPHFFGGDFVTSIASETPPPTATAAPVPDSPHEGVRAPGVESGTENELACKSPELACKLDEPIIGDPAHSDVQYAEVTETADRLARVAVGLPPVPPAPHPAHLVVDGDCESWRPLLESYGIPYDEARPIMWRESRCTMAVNYNPSTRDASHGPLQVNRYGSLAAWWDAGGYTVEVMSTPEGAVAAAAVLYHSCGWMPWQPPYGCDGDYLQTPAPVWGGS